ncbi:MAG: hypothetical protein Q7R85_01140 [bacterium]|nr:hypothetical protein [bacterium]
MAYNSNQPKKSYQQVPKLSRAAQAEFGAGKKGLIICKNCGAVYFKKHWHHSLDRLNNPEAAGLAKNNAAVAFAKCPACTMIANKRYEGRIVIKGVPEKSRTALEELIRGYGDRAYDRDPMDRLIAVVTEGSKWTVTATENQLVNKLARKIKDEFHKVKLTHRFAGEPSVVEEVTVEFPHD